MSKYNVCIMRVSIHCKLTHQLKYSINTHFVAIQYFSNQYLTLFCNIVFCDNSSPSINFYFTLSRLYI